MSLEDELLRQRRARIREIESMGYRAYGKRYDFTHAIPQILAEYSPKTAEELSPATVEALGPDFEIRHCDGANRSELLPAIADVDAILIRSATQVTAELLA